MNKNDKLNGITPSENKNNVNELNDDTLESVAGGSYMDMLNSMQRINTNPNPVPPITVYKKCPSCGESMLGGKCHSCGYSE